MAGHNEIHDMKSSSDTLSPTLIAIASATTTVTVVLFAVLAIITPTAAYLRHMSKVNHQMTNIVIYEEVTFQPRAEERMIKVQSNEAYQEPSTIKASAAFAQVQC